MNIIFNTEEGVLSFNSNIIDQIIEKALRKWEGFLWLANYKGIQGELAAKADNLSVLADRDISYSKKGVFIRLYLVLKFGTSISESTTDIMNQIASDIRNTLDLEIDNIEIKITGIASKKVAPRDITIRYTEPENL